MDHLTGIDMGGLLAAWFCQLKEDFDALVKRHHHISNVKAPSCLRKMKQITQRHLLEEDGHRLR